MKGSYKIEINTRKINYDLEINRNITIIKGFSATGKTTIINLINDYNNKQQYVNIKCKCDLDIMNDSNWELLIRNKNKTIFFIDEDSLFVKTHDFARYINEGNDNYFVIISRIDYKSLKYSVDEIYELETYGNKTKMIKYYKKYKSNLNKDLYNNTDGINKIITEDSNSGYLFYSEFFKYIYKVNKIYSSNGKSKIINIIDKDLKNLIIADGAAFGNEIDSILNNIEYGILGSSTLYLPESFEWVLLNTDEFKDIWYILDNPEIYIDSLMYSSYERFYYYLIRDILKNKDILYNKSKLDKYFLNNNFINKLNKIIPEFNVSKNNELNWE